MKHRGLTWDPEKKEYKWVYGLASYGYGVAEISEIGTLDGDFYKIIPESLGEEAGYKDCKGRMMFTGDIVTLEVDGEVREFVVERATVEREYKTLPGHNGETVKVRLSEVVVFCWTSPDGIRHQLLPCVDCLGVDDTSRMKIIDTAAERAVSKSKSNHNK